MNRTLPPTRHGSLAGFDKPTKSGRTTGRVSKRQWLDAALDVLAVDGVGAVRITALAKTLNISKSGFYWHFKNREDLLAEMKTYWTDEFNQQIISEVLEQENLPEESLLRAVEMIRNRQSGKFDLAFNSWAQHDPLVRELVDQVRDMRILFVRTLLADTGCTESELEARARLFVVYFSWSEVMYRKTPVGLEGEPLEVILKIITGSIST